MWWGGGEGGGAEVWEGMARTSRACQRQVLWQQTGPHHTVNVAMCCTHQACSLRKHTAALELVAHFSENPASDRLSILYSQPSGMQVPFNRLLRTSQLAPRLTPLHKANHWARTSHTSPLCCLPLTPPLSLLVREASFSQVGNLVQPAFWQAGAIRQAAQDIKWGVARDLVGR